MKVIEFREFGAIYSKLYSTQACIECIFESFLQSFVFRLYKIMYIDTDEIVHHFSACHLADRFPVEFAP